MACIASDVPSDVRISNDELRTRQSRLSCKSRNTFSKSLIRPLVGHYWETYSFEACILAGVRYGSVKTCFQLPAYSVILSKHCSNCSPDASLVNGSKLSCCIA